MKNQVNSPERRSHGRSLPPNPHHALRIVQEGQARSWTRSLPARAMEKTDRRLRHRPRPLLLQARSAPRRQRQHGDHAEASLNPDPSLNPAADLRPGLSDGVPDHLPLPPPLPPPPRVNGPHDPPSGLVQIWKVRGRGRSLRRLPVSGSGRPTWPGTRRGKKGAYWKKKAKGEQLMR